MSPLQKGNLVSTDPTLSDLTSLPLPLAIRPSTPLLGFSQPLSRPHYPGHNRGLHIRATIQACMATKSGFSYLPLASHQDYRTPQAPNSILRFKHSTVLPHQGDFTSTALADFPEITTLVWQCSQPLLLQRQPTKYTASHPFLHIAFLAPVM